MEEQQFVDLEKVEGLIPKLEEEEILSSNDVDTHRFVVMLNWTLLSAVIIGSLWWLQFNYPRPGSPVNADVPMHEPQTPSLHHTLSRAVLLVGILLSFCIALLIVLSKILMCQYMLILMLLSYDTHRLPKNRVQCLRAIPASMPTWFMQLLKSFWWIFTLVQLVITMAILVIRWFFTGSLLPITLPPS
ncbi:hypothetical protein F4604DRAFT_1960360 [Suillus subluteus]|nr:hypothetical protein F4604DRAFT_1960360 [Suillus subluteus]